MNDSGSLWAFAFEDTKAAKRAQEIIRTLQDAHCLMLDQVAIVTCSPDGTHHLDREPSHLMATPGGCGLIRVLTGLVGGMNGALSVPAASVPGVSDEFICEVEELMTPGSTILFLMDEWGDREAILDRFCSLGGKALRTTVEPEWAGEVHAALEHSSRYSLV